MGASALLAIASIIAFSQVSKTGAVLATAVLAFVTFLCPAVLVWAQRYKKRVILPFRLLSSDTSFSEIRGPWDPAVPVVNATD